MSIGSQLKKARQRKQITLNEVYVQTRIHPNVLGALEEDRFDRLDASYRKSFLKEYSGFLGLDVQAVLAEYGRLYPSKDSVDLEQASNLEARSVKRRALPLSLNLRHIIRILGIAISSALAIFLIVVVSRFVMRLAGRRSRAAVSQLKKKRPQKKAGAIEGERPAKAIGRGLPKEPAARQKKARKLSISAKEKLKLRITARDDCWINLKVDGEIIAQTVLKKGSSEMWEASKSFGLWAGRAEALNLNLNGFDLGAPGRGVEKEITITREGIKRR